MPLEVIVSDASFYWGNARTHTVLLATKREDQKRKRLNTHLDLSNDAADFPCPGLSQLSRSSVIGKTEKLIDAGVPFEDANLRCILLRYHVNEDWKEVAEPNDDNKANKQKAGT